LGFAGSMVVQVNSDERGAVTLWQPGETDAKTISLSEETYIRSRALSPDGLYVAESGEDGTHVYSIDRAKAQLKPLAEMPNNGKTKAWCLALSRSAQFAAAGYWDGTVHVYKLSPDVGESLRDSLPVSQRPAYGITFEKKLAHTPTQIALSDDGQRLAVFTQKDGLVLIELTTGQQSLLWAGGVASVTCAKFTPDGRRVIAGLNDGTARMWSVPDGCALLVVDAGHAPRDVAWSAETSLLATAGGKMKLWDCEVPE
jgi:WD40 repeat protein